MVMNPIGHQHYYSSAPDTSSFVARANTATRRQVDAELRKFGLESTDHGDLHSSATLPQSRDRQRNNEVDELQRTSISHAAPVVRPAAEH